MARTPRNELSPACRGVSVYAGERRTVTSPVNGQVAESIAWIQDIGTHLGAPSDFMGSSLVPSSGVEVQPEVQTGCLADGLNVHQPMCMGLQPSRTDLDVLTLAEFEADQRLESTDNHAANLQTVFPLEFEFGNQSSESIRASPFQSDGLLASVLACAAGNPTSNALYAAPTASDYDFPPALCRAPQVMSPLPDILPIEEAEKLHLLNRLFELEQDQSLENASSLSPPEQLNQPNHFEWPMQMVNHDPPCHSHTSRSPLPLSEMIQGHPATHPQSFPFGHWHQQSSQQTLTDLDEHVQMQALGSAPFHSSASNERCAMEYSAGYGPPPPTWNVNTDILPNIVEGAPTEREHLPLVEGAPTILPDNAIVQFLDMARQIQRIENEIQMLEQSLRESQQLVAALCNVNQRINDLETAVARVSTSSACSWMDTIEDPLALTAVYFHLIHFAAFQ